MPSFDLLAGAVWPGLGEWIPDAVLSVRRGKIVSLRSGANRRTMGKALDFRPWVIAPGFVNAHIHLELTGLKLHRPARGQIAPWIRELVGKRQRNQFPPAERAATQGIRRCLAGGTTAVGEIESAGASYRALCRSKLRALVFREFLGLDPSRARQSAADARKSLVRMESSALRLGLSPHAPYSLAPQLWKFAVSIARSGRAPLAMHLAESAQERELLLRGTGGLAQSLRALGRLPSGWEAPKLGPVELLARHGLLRRSTLLVHGNDLRPTELDRVRRAGCSLVFCPGSHRFFRYPAYPLRGILRRGIPLALGTDSLASNEDLSMLREMSILQETDSGLSPESILHMATHGGARALQWESRIGSLRPGKEADFVVLRVEPGRSARETIERIVSSQPKIVATFVGGQRAFPESKGVL